MVKHIVRFMRDEDGAAAAEYALILAVLTLGIVVASQGLGTAITGALNAAAQTITTAAS